MRIFVGWRNLLVEATGLEPAASWSQTKHSTKLSYASLISPERYDPEVQYDTIPLHTIQFSGEY